MLIDKQDRQGRMFINPTRVVTAVENPQGGIIIYLSDARGNEKIVHDGGTLEAFDQEWQHEMRWIHGGEEG